MKKTGVLLPTISQLPIINKEPINTKLNYNDPTKLTFFSIELDSETTRITSSISTTLLTTNSRETSKDRSLLTDMAQELGLGKVSDIMSYLCA